MLRDVDLIKVCIREAGEYKRGLQRMFATGCFGAPGESRNSSLVVSSVPAEGKWALRSTVFSVILIEG